MHDERRDGSAPQISTRVLYQHTCIVLAHVYCTSTGVLYQHMCIVLAHVYCISTRVLYQHMYCISTRVLYQHTCIVLAHVYCISTCVLYQHTCIVLAHVLLYQPDCMADGFLVKTYRMERQGLCMPVTKHIICCSLFNYNGGTRQHSWLRHCATSRKVTGSVPDGVIEIFH